MRVLLVLALCVAVAFAQAKAEGKPAAAKAPSPSTLSAISLSDVEFFAGIPSAASTKTIRLSYPKGLASTASVAEGGRVRIAFKVVDSGSRATFAVQQAVVEFSKGTSSIVYPTVKEGEQHVLTLSIDAEASGFNWQGGEYSVRILVGDVKATPISWTVGALSISFPERGAVGDNSVFTPHALVQHKFREDAKRAPAFFALIFAVVSIGLLVVFILSALKLGNLRGFPTSFSALVSAAGFHGGLGLLFVIYALYWLGLNFFQTLPYFVPVAVGTWLFGTRILSAIATGSQKQ